MCGRLTLRTSAEEIATAFDVPEVPALFPRYNIAPTQPLLAIRIPTGTEDGGTTGEREAVLLRWGLIPSWAKDAKIGNATFNARADTVATKPAFRSAFKRRRCLVIADGFYEWKRSEEGTKQPYHMSMTDGRPFALAGLWEFWKGPDGPVESCTILTTDANSLMAPLHDRMPVILPDAACALWLDPAVQEPQVLLPLLCPYSPDPMQARPVSTIVNNARNERPECVEPLAL